MDWIDWTYLKYKPIEILTESPFYRFQGPLNCAHSQLFF